MTRRVVLRCPLCGKISLHKLSPHLRQAREDIDEGLVPVLIKHFVCTHLFIAYVDRNWQIRHYIPVDYKVNHPYSLILEETRTLSVKVAQISGVAEAS